MEKGFHPLACGGAGWGSENDGETIWRVAIGGVEVWFMFVEGRGGDGVAINR